MAEGQKEQSSSRAEDEDGVDRRPRREVGCEPGEVPACERPCIAVKNLDSY